MGLVISTPPAAEPVSQAEAKNWLRVSTAADDDLIDMLISGARSFFEEATNRALISQTLDYSIDCFRPVIYLPRAPLASVTSISYVDSAGSSQTLSSSVYRVDTASLQGRVTLAQNQTWPATAAVTNAVTIRYVAGYGASSASVPDRIRVALLMLIADNYEHREGQTEITIRANAACAALIAQAKVYDFGVQP